MASSPSMNSTRTLLSAAIAAALLASACSTTTATPSAPSSTATATATATATPTPTAVPTATPITTTTVTLSGDLTGSLTSVKTDCHPEAPFPPPSVAASGTLGGREYDLNLFDPSAAQGDGINGDIRISLGEPSTPQGGTEDSWWSTSSAGIVGWTQTGTTAFHAVLKGGFGTVKTVIVNGAIVCP